MSGIVRYCRQFFLACQTSNMLGLFMESVCTSQLISFFASSCSASLHAEQPSMHSSHPLGLRQWWKYFASWGHMLSHKFSNMGHALVWMERHHGVHCSGILEAVSESGLNFFFYQHLVPPPPWGSPFNNLLVRQNSPTSGDWILFTNFPRTISTLVFFYLLFPYILSWAKSLRW